MIPTKLMILTCFDACLSVLVGVEAIGRDSHPSMTIMRCFGERSFEEKNMAILEPHGVSDVFQLVSVNR